MITCRAFFSCSSHTHSIFKCGNCIEYSLRSAFSTRHHILKTAWPVWHSERSDGKDKPNILGSIDGLWINRLIFSLFHSKSCCVRFFSYVFISHFSSYTIIYRNNAPSVCRINWIIHPKTREINSRATIFLLRKMFWWFKTASKFSTFILFGCTLWNTNNCNDLLFSNAFLCFFFSI